MFPQVSSKSSRYPLGSIKAARNVVQLQLYMPELYLDDLCAEGQIKILHL